MEVRFQGVLPPVTTPFSQEGEILGEELERNLGRYRTSGVSGILMLGSNGEAPHLEEGERIDLLKRAESAWDPDRVLMAGVSAQSLRGCLRFLEKISRLRIDAVLVSVPHYYRNEINGPVLYRFFCRVADEAPFPVLLYNVPQYTEMEIPVSAVADLAEHPNVVGMKDSSGDMGYLEQTLQATGQSEDFQLILGSIDILEGAFHLGVQAGILAVACALPELTARLFLDQLEGREIGHRQAELVEISRIVGAHGVSGLKYAMDLAGLSGGECRLPLEPLDPEEKEWIGRLFTDFLSRKGVEG